MQQSTISDIDQKELNAVIQKVNKFRLRYLILQVFITLILLGLLLFVFLQFNWVFLLLTIVMISIIYRVNQFTKKFSDSYKLLKKDLLARKKITVSGILETTEIDNNNLVYNISTSRYSVLHWQTYIGWQLTSVQSFIGSKVTVSYLPNSKLLMNTNYKVEPNVSESKPLNEEQKKAFTAAKMTIKNSTMITGIVTEVLEMQYSVKSMLLPVKSANIIRNINSTKINFVRIESELFQLQKTIDYAIGKTGTVQLFE
ncbi:MAG: hypothetical protein DI598_04930 [Pseudopedobacter saltans]|uniref:Uncharacterized protein n=1 Tax=Pseudopedobacter saltans TaxID=151895 RepID=A0A2W5H554_9SPHI|nr:MAG: hypothetical protein DI598_04930 [Pseudopedobacter saltans]